ncbi:hypothetical protein KY327_01370 [Candidatus Woesearchaeota archaeon]|nr:hypothetical protein [Candidatus Woesearchaeota archaeon]
MRQRRGQTSIEFLTTYAWAFLGLLVTVGALNYLGILEPSSYTPERCSSGTQISCIDTYLAADEESQDTTLLLMLSNNYPRNIIIENVTLTNIRDDQEVGMDTSPTPIEPGRSYTAAFSFLAAFTEGHHESVNFVITYRREGGSTSYNISGSSIINVQEAPATPEPFCGDGNIYTAEECDPAYTGSQCGGDDCRSDCTCE